MLFVDKNIKIFINLFEINKLTKINLLMYFYKKLVYYSRKC